MGADRKMQAALLRGDSVQTVMRRQRTADEEERLVKLFTQWANFLLERRGLQIESVGKDISDGLILIQLAEILTNVPVAKHQECPTLLIHNIENLTIALEHFTVHGGVDSSYVSPSALANNDVKQILSLFWMFALKFKMKDLKNRWAELQRNGAKHNQFVQLKKDMKQITDDGLGAPLLPRSAMMTIKRNDDQVRNLLKQQAMSKYVAAAESLRQWVETTTTELEEANRALDVESAAGPPGPGPAIIAHAENLRSARESFRGQEKAINEGKLKRKTLAEDAYIEMKKAGCSDPAYCPFATVEECTNKLEGVLFERRRKLDEHLRRADEEAEREREQARLREAASTRLAQQLEAERERQEEEKKRMEFDLRERARLLKQELLKLKGEERPGSAVVAGGAGLTAAGRPSSGAGLVRSDSGGLVNRSSSDADKPQLDPRKILNAECTTGSMGSFLLRRQTRREEEGAPCTSCKKLLGNTLMLLVDGKELFHSTCFVCKRCGKEFDDYYYEHRGEVPLCFEHYAEASGLSCNGCGQVIRTSTVTLAMGKKWHSHCFACVSCHTVLKDGHYVHEGQPYCQLDFYRAKGLLCVRCETPVGVGDKSFEGRAWHKSCWTCTTCNRPFGKDGFYGVNGLPFCGTHYEEMELRGQTKTGGGGDKFGSWSRRMQGSGGLTEGMTMSASGVPLPSRSRGGGGLFGDNSGEWDDEERSRRRREQLAREKEKEEAVLRADMDRRKREQLEREKEAYVKELERKKREIERDLEREQWRSLDRERERDRDHSSRDRDRDRYSSGRDRESSLGRDGGRSRSQTARESDRDRDRDLRDPRDRDRERELRDRDRDRDPRDRDRERSRDRDGGRSDKGSLGKDRDKELRERRASMSYTSGGSGRRSHY